MTPPPPGAFLFPSGFSLSIVEPPRNNNNNTAKQQRNETTQQQQSTSVSPTTLKPQRHFLDRRSKSMQTPQSGGTGCSTLSASHQQLTTMSSLGAERYPARKMLQKHPNLASQDEPPQFLLSTAASSSTGDYECSSQESGAEQSGWRSLKTGYLPVADPA